MELSNTKTDVGVPWYTAPQNLDKGLLMQEARIFSDTPIDVPRCKSLIVKLMHLVANRPSNISFTRTEATDIFFALTKLFQSDDLILRRMVYLLMKELVGKADDTIIIVSSLTKDMTKPIPEFRSNAIRLLSRVVDGQMLGQLDRFMRTGVVDREPAVSSATIVSGIHLMGVCPEVVRRWGSEAREASTVKSGLVQYHALGLLHAMQRGDRRALTKLLLSNDYAGVKQPLVQCALIRIAKQILCEEKNPENCLKHPSDIVILEAARSLCSIPTLPPKHLTNAVTSLKALLRGKTPLRRYASLRTLESLADRYSTLVSTCNDEFELLTRDSNQLVSTTAISCLLKTSSEDNLESLIKHIYTRLADIPDDFRIRLIASLRTLGVTYESKATQIVKLFCAMLHQVGSYEFKSAAVCATVFLAAHKPSLLELAATGLCEFAEDCEHPALGVEILSFLGEMAGALPDKTRCLRCVYNRTVLESVAVRSAAVTAIAKFGMEVPELRSQALVLLNRVCVSDSEDGVRDSAVLYSEAIKTCDNQSSLSAIVSPVLSTDLDSLAKSLELYLSNEDNVSTPFDISSVKSMISASTSAAQTLSKSVNTASISATVASYMGDALRLESEASSKDVLFGNNGSAPSGSLGELAEQYPELGGLGECWKESQDAIPLTEKDTEYVVSYKKYLFDQHVLLVFSVENTLPSQRLVDVHVDITAADALSEDFAVEFAAAATKPAICGKDPVSVPVLLAVPSDSFRAKFSGVLRFAVVEIDELTGEPSGAETEAEEDEYPLDDFTITMGDFVRPFDTDEFDGEWVSLGSEGEYMERFSLASVKTLQDAVRETLSTLGMTPINDTDKIKPGTTKHILLMSGRFVGDTPMLARARMICRNKTSDEGVMMELTVRSPKAEYSVLLVTSISN